MRKHSGLKKFFYQNMSLVTIEEEFTKKIFRTPTQPLAVQEYDRKSATSKKIYAVDKAGTVVIMEGLETHKYQNYCAYGYLAVDLPENSRLGFNGEFLEEKSDFYLLGMGYRMYDLKTMRFTSPDNLSPFDEGGINSYSYCMGDPINYSDPSGHMPMLPIFSGANRPSNQNLRHYSTKLSLKNLEINRKIRYLEELDNIYQAGSDNVNRIYSRSGAAPSNSIKLLKTMEKDADRTKNSILRLIDKRDKIQAKYQEAYDSVLKASGAFLPSAPRLSVMSTISGSGLYSPSAPRFSILSTVSDYGPSAPRASIISLNPNNDSYTPSAPFASTSSMIDLDFNTSKVAVRMRRATI
ncbi:RHS repeat-associated core domain-containing protein [Pseudomonas sp.]|uniref:RHS repeat-associated core domain-containing protein n=1 Tax=Pseudomonas sp. TaxID=306 RepID=UPI0028A9E8A5|nr:RHS repeat-associated core domain-containing protein [Pseudomonas sp.]